MGGRDSWFFWKFKALNKWKGCMSLKYREFKQLDLPSVSRKSWRNGEAEKTFEASVNSRGGRQSLLFTRAPSANGLPAFTMSWPGDQGYFCRYKTLKGFQVKRKGSWDTHGLPIELSVEKTFWASAKMISGKQFPSKSTNKACRKEVMKLQRRVGRPHT